MLNSLYSINNVISIDVYLSGDQFFGDFDVVVLVLLAFAFQLEQQLYEVVTAHAVVVTVVNGLFYDAHEELLHVCRERSQFQRSEHFWEEHSNYFRQRL